MDKPFLKKKSTVEKEIALNLFFKLRFQRRSSRFRKRTIVLKNYSLVLNIWKTNNDRL